MAARPLTRALRPHPFSPRTIPFRTPFFAPCPSCRTFSSSPLTLKKKSRNNGPDEIRTPGLGPENPNGESIPTEEDTNPSNFSTMNETIAFAERRFDEELKKLKPGGRIDASVIEEAGISLGGESEGSSTGKDNEKAGKGRGEKKKGGGGGGGASVRLGDIASVVPRTPRTVDIIVHDEAHVKPICTSLLASIYSLNPQPSPSAPLTLNVTLPPPTAESKATVLKEAEKLRDLTLHKVTAARGTHHKYLIGLKKVKSVRPDDIHKADEELKGLLAKAKERVTNRYNIAKKALEG